MSELSTRNGRTLWPAAMTAIAAALASPAYAQSATAPVPTANVSPATVNVINLLSPFLTLNSTATGQQTLQTNLTQAVAINQNAPSAALINNNYSTSVLGALAINDENSLGTASTQLYGSAVTVGVAANIAGALPTQATGTYALYNGQQPQVSVNGTPTSVGAFGSVLGPAYVAAVSPSGPTLTNTVALLTTAFSFTGNSLATGDSQVAKFYFANGTINGTTAAVAPAGYTLPTVNGLPNTTNSVYDTAYGVSNTQNGQNGFGDSHPYQTHTSGDPGASYTLYDPTVQTASTVKGAVNPDKPSSNPSFPSSHMAYSMTDGILLGMLTPQLYQATLLRASEIGNSRIVVGVHYPTDIIASRAFVSYDLAQYLSNPTYVNNASVTGTAVNLPGLFTSAEGEIQKQLAPAAAAAGCGTSVATCATSSVNVNPYAPSAENAAVYAARLTYGLPTLSFTQAPAEAAPAGGPDASILLATVYGGSTSAAPALAPTGGMYGNLSTGTINQIIENTETNALAAYYGTSLSYWSRLSLYGAIGYFSGMTGSLALQSTDTVNEPVTVASGGVLGGAGTIVGATNVQSGGELAPCGFNAFNQPATPGTLTITGALTLNSGSTYAVQVGSTASLANVSGTATVSGASVAADFVGGATIAEKYKILSAGSVSGTFAGLTNSGLPGGLTDQLTYDASDAYLTLSLSPSLAGAANANESAVIGGLNAALAANGSLPTTFASLSGQSLELATGEVGAASHGAVNASVGGFMNAFFNGGLGDSGAPTRGGADIAMFYADPQLPTRKGGAVDALPTPFAPYWTVWSQTSGASRQIDGAASVGSNSTTQQAFAETVGAEYRVARETAFGFGFGGGSESFSVANGLGSGHYDFGEIGGYAVHDFKAFYVAGAVSAGSGTVNTSRADPTGALVQGSFEANNIAGRVEIGGKIATGLAVFSPYAAVQATHVALPAYAETSTGAFALNYAAQNVDDATSELGVRLSHDFAQNGATFTLGGQLAWAHDFNPAQFANVSFAALPSSNFTVTAASPAADSALVSLGGKAGFANGFAVEARFEGEFAANVRTYGGRATLSYSW